MSVDDAATAVSDDAIHPTVSSSLSMGEDLAAGGTVRKDVAIAEERVPSSTCHYTGSSIIMALLQRELKEKGNLTLSIAPAAWAILNRPIGFGIFYPVPERMWMSACPREGKHDEVEPGKSDMPEIGRVSSCVGLKG